MTIKSSESNPIFSIEIQQPVKNFSVDFFYNFYVNDESVQENPNIPDIYKVKTIEKSDINLSTFSLRVPRYVEIKWSTSQNSKSSKRLVNKSIADNLNKIFTEDSITSKYVPYVFSSTKSLENAADSVNNGAFSSKSNGGISQAAIIDNFANNLLNGYAETPETTDKEVLRNQIKLAIQSIEKIADKPSIDLQSNSDSIDEKGHDFNIETEDGNDLKLQN